jgi:hypothetical protein
MAVTSIVVASSVAGSLGLATPSGSARRASWAPCRADAHLTGRSGHALTYDEQARRVLLFGGAAPAESAGDRPPAYPSSLWSWEGTQWNCVADGGPPGRIDPGFAYDRARHRAVLFGGRQRTAVGINLLADTWEWDGGHWEERDSTGPGPRVHFAMGFDAKRAAVVLYGGGAERGPLGDTWLWNGTQWTRIDDGPPRLADGIVEDPQSGRALLVSAIEDATATDGTAPVAIWTLDANGHWSPRALGGPRFSPTAPVSRTLGGLLMFAGWEPDHRTAMHLWNGQAWSTVATDLPGSRRGAAVTFDTRRNCVVLYGGEDTTGILNDTSEWDGRRWNQRTGREGALPLAPARVTRCAGEKKPSDQCAGR